MIPIVIPAYAKINLAIDVIGKEKNYHKLDMVMIPLKLHDTIELSIIKNSKYKNVYIYCDDPSIECDESNSAYKAFSLFRKNYCDYDACYRIFIYKRIPVEAGLGGGSADASAVLKALAKFIDGGTEINDNLLSIAKSVGSDVPFSLFNLPSRVQGIGEIMSPIEIKTKYYVLLVKPKQGLSTTKIYQLFDKLTQKKSIKPNIPKLIQGLKEDNEELISKNMINVLTPIAIKVLPEINFLLGKFKEFDLPLSGMSGTGSACFALHKDKRKLKSAAKFFSSQGLTTILTEFNV